MVSVTVESAPVPNVVRVLGSSLQQKLDELLDEDPDLCCPVSLMVFEEPVIASDGFIYEKSSLLTLLKNRQVSPMTREVLKQAYRPAQEKKQQAEDFRQTRCQVLLEFVREAMLEQREMAVTALDRVGDYLEKLRTRKSSVLAQEASQFYAQLGRAPPAGLNMRLGPVTSDTSATSERRPRPTSSSERSESRWSTSSSNYG